MSNYRPDFIIENKYIYEIKPEVFQTIPKVLAKAEGAKNFCLKNNLEYRILDIYVDRKLILSKFEQIKFQNNGEQRFLKRRFGTKGYITPEEQSKILFPFWSCGKLDFIKPLRKRLDL